MQIQKMMFYMHQLSGLITVKVILISVSTNRLMVLQKLPLIVQKCAMHFVRKQLKK